MALKFHQIPCFFASQTIPRMALSRLFLSSLFSLLLVPACRSQPSSPDDTHGIGSSSDQGSLVEHRAEDPVVRQTDARTIQTGADKTDQWLALLRDKRIALVVNQTSTIGQQHLVDTLIDLGITIQNIFAPEHGFRGTADAGAKLEDGKDEKSGLTLYSLYGSSKKPSAQQLQDVDLVVFDIQDVGARFYTYISTLHYVMEACAEQKIPIVVLDRPNPNGHYMDGPVLEPAFKSFVGMDPIPLVHGMTVGELAQMINGEGWLAKGIKARLRVIPCSGWTHQTSYVLPIAPSPNLPTQRSIYLYPSLCLFEGTIVSVGRGTPWPFEVIGHPGFGLGSFGFTPKPGPGAAHPLLEGQSCFGTSFKDMLLTDLRAQGHLMLGPLISYYEVLHKEYPFFLNNGFFDKLAGTDQLRKQIESGQNEDEIRASWQPALQAFARQRKPYLLYPE